MILGKPDTYIYESSGPNPSCNYLWKSILNILHDKKILEGTRVFEIGCGNGSTANMLVKKGYDVTGIDPSVSGIEIANKAFPNIKLMQGSVYDDLVGEYGKFPVVISLEVVEHLTNPRLFAKNLFRLLEDGGVGIISTPYHGYLKNLILALSGKMDEHYSALWDGGHIKFWSIRTLKILLEEAGFENVTFLRVGRIKIIAKSMIVIVGK